MRVVPSIGRFFFRYFVLCLLVFQEPYTEFPLSFPRGVRSPVKKTTCHDNQNTSKCGRPKFPFQKMGRSENCGHLFSSPPSLPQAAVTPPRNIKTLTPKIPHVNHTGNLLLAWIATRNMSRRQQKTTPTQPRQLPEVTNAVKPSQRATQNTTNASRVNIPKIHHTHLLFYPSHAPAILRSKRPSDSAVCVTQDADPRRTLRQFSIKSAIYPTCRRGGLHSEKTRGASALPG